MSGIKEIGNLDLPKLEKIELSKNLISDFTPVAQWKCPSLKQIFFSSCQIEKTKSLNLSNLE